MGEEKIDPDPAMTDPDPDPDPATIVVVIGSLIGLPLFSKILFSKAGWLEEKSRKELSLFF